MEQRVFDEFSELEERHWWFRGRRDVIWALLRDAGLPPSPSILDAGCGPGRNLLEFASLGTAVGVDASEHAVEVCARRGLPEVVQSRIERLPFEDGRFDLVLACDVIEHIEDDITALRELRRVTASDGHLIITVPAHRWLWGSHDDRLDHRRRYSRGGLHAAAEAGGWRRVRLTYYNSALLPLITIARWLQRLRPPEARHSDYAVAPGLNEVLYKPMAVEARAIMRGLDLPVGVSLAMLCSASA